MTTAYVSHDNISLATNLGGGSRSTNWIIFLMVEIHCRSLRYVTMATVAVERLVHWRQKYLGKSLDTWSELIPASQNLSDCSGPTKWIIRLRDEGSLSVVTCRHYGDCFCWTVLLLADTNIWENDSGCVASGTLRMSTNGTKSVCKIHEKLSLFLVIPVSHKLHSDCWNSDYRASYLYEYSKQRSWIAIKDLRLFS